MKIRWENKYSKETGYVKKLNHKDGYFENTCSEEEAMEISDRQDIAEKTVALLEKWSGQNIYILIPTEKKPEQKISAKEETAELIIEVEQKEEDDNVPVSVSEPVINEEEVTKVEIELEAEKTEEQLSEKKDCIPSGDKPKDRKTKKKKAV